MNRFLDKVQSSSFLPNDEDGHLAIVPSKNKPHYTLDELLAKCDQTAPMPQELIDWDNLQGVGNERGKAISL